LTSAATTPHWSTRRPAAATSLAGQCIVSEWSANVHYETTCCSNLSGLCEWIEPVGWLCVDEDDRKFAVWTEEDCELIHPDDIRIYEKRRQAWLDSELQAANALV